MYTPFQLFPLHLDAVMIEECHRSSPVSRRPYIISDKAEDRTNAPRRCYHLFPGREGTLDARPEGTAPAKDGEGGIEVKEVHSP